MSGALPWATIPRQTQLLIPLKCRSIFQSKLFSGTGFPEFILVVPVLADVLDRDLQIPAWIQRESAPHHHFVSNLVVRQFSRPFPVAYTEMVVRFSPTLTCAQQLNQPTSFSLPTDFRTPLTQT